MTKVAAIIGGGYAGMAAAVELADAGVKVAVFEAAKELGGRARRVTLHGMALDNGQHVLLGAYRETLDIIAKVHPNAHQAMLRQPLDLVVADEFRLTAADLPAPLDLAVGLMRARGLSVGERFSVTRFLLRVKLSGFQLNGNVSAGDLLFRAGQSSRCIRLLWEPLCVSALNTPLHAASAQVFMHVLQDSVLRGGRDSDLIIPREDLTSLFPAPAADYVIARGGEIHGGCTIRGLVEAEGGYRLDGADTPSPFAGVIVAVSPHRLLPLLEGWPALAPVAKKIGTFTYQPIVTCYLQYPESVRLQAPMLGMASSKTQRLGQWAFDRGALSGIPGLIAVVISGSGPHQALSQDELAERLHTELQGIIPDLPAPLWHQVIAEKRATFSCRPNLDRPILRTPLPGIFLAGDYLDSRYPATLESAVQSGRTAAQAVINFAGRFRP
jgi:squalene-associated FAD-dependent desaturase